MNRNQIQIRDPYIFTDNNAGKYFLFGTTDPDPWNKQGIGFDAYWSGDLENWRGPTAAFRPPAGFWGTHDYWAPEVHFFNGFYYMFATFTSNMRRRGTQILRAKAPLGPYVPHSKGAATPEDWECLDGTLFVDENEKPWMVFCHEWVQVNDGEICAIELDDELKGTIGGPKLLFKASSASWPKLLPRRDGTNIADARVTDGPFAYRRKDGTLLFLWSSLAEEGYAMGIARSGSGTLDGPWIQDEKPLISCDGGHGMVFRSLDGKLYATYHSPNKTPFERFQYAEIVESGKSLALAGGDK